MPAAMGRRPLILQGFERRLNGEAIGHQMVTVENFQHGAASRAAVLSLGPGSGRKLNSPEARAALRTGDIALFHEVGFYSQKSNQDTGRMPNPAMTSTCVGAKRNPGSGCVRES